MTARRFLMASLVVAALLPAGLPIGSCAGLPGGERVERESLLKTRLRTMRDTIDQYYADKGQYPPRLESLVEDQYLRSLPIDPITGRSDSWLPVYQEATLLADQESTPGGPGPRGVWDVRSAASGATIEGIPYRDL